MTDAACLRFVPSAVEGLSEVSEVAVFPDRLEIQTGDGPVVIRFLDIARWHRHGWFYRALVLLGFGVRGWACVADKDWFHPPAERFFRFYTKPAITISMPDEPIDAPYGDTLFLRLQEVVRAGGFATFDLG